MGINFPASPTVGQKYPQPAVAGIPVYTWDGEKWTTVGGSVAAYAPPSTTLPLIDATPAVIGTGTAYARNDHVHPTDTSRAALTYVDSADANRVRWDAAQTLTAPQQQQARQNIYAASFDAMAYGGLQINGAMEISQERGSNNPITLNGYYICDGWKLVTSGTFAVSCAQVPGPTFFPGFACLLYLQTTGAQTTLGASDYFAILQPIEGWRMARLGWGTANAQPITLSFWSNHHRTGLYSGTVRNGSTTRNYTFTYTHAAADVPQYNSITIPGDTAGTWPIDNTLGAYLTFSNGAGSGFIAPSANTWLAGSYHAAPGQVNGAAATSDIFRLTGVTILPGNEAPSAARSPFVMRPRDEELTICKRYWEAVSVMAITTMTSAGYPVGTSSQFMVEKRATPTIAQITQSVMNFTWSGWQAGGVNYFWVYGTAITSGQVNIAYTISVDARL